MSISFSDKEKRNLRQAIKHLFDRISEERDVAKDGELQCVIPRSTAEVRGVSSNGSKHQYKIETLATLVADENKGRFVGRKTLARVHFVTKPNEFFNDTLTVSHLCHNEVCVKREHVCLETLKSNKDRNNCSGPAHCEHNPQCLTRGNSYDPNPRRGTLASSSTRSRNTDSLSSEARSFVVKSRSTEAKTKKRLKTLGVKRKRHSDGSESEEVE
jgi:hypothetical protein